MVKRLIIAAVGVVGLVVIGLGVASATVWRADDILVAGTSDGPHTLVTEPGVLELGGDPVTVKVTVPDKGQVTLAIGRDTDVEGWVGTEAYGQVTGLDSWHELAVTGVEDTTPEPSPEATASDPAAAAPPPTPTPTPDAEADSATATDPAGSDLWVAQSTGKGSASLEWPQQEGRWSLIAVSTGKSAPNLTLAWPREVTTPWLWPAVVGGLVLVLLSGWLLFRDVYRHRKGLDEEWHPVTTGAIPAVLAEDVDAIPVLTRRQMREAAAARGARPAPRTGQVPQVSPPLDDAEVRTATTPVDGPPTSRRALRSGSPQTSPTAVVPAASDADPTTSAAAAASAARASSATPTPTAPASGSWTPAPRPTGMPSGSPVGAPAGSPAGPASGSPTGSASGSPSGPASGSPVGAPANGSTPTDAEVAHDRRPSWLSTPTGATPATGPAAPAQGASATPVAPSAKVPPPPVGPVVPGTAISSPGKAAPAPTSGPGSVRGATAWATVTAPTPEVRSAETDPHAGRPAWLATTTPEAPQEPAAGGSRADAWRRAWGLPPTEGESTSTSASTSPENDQTDEQEDGR